MLYHLGSVSFALHFENFLIYPLLIALLLTFNNELFSFLYKTNGYSYSYHPLSLEYYQFSPHLHES